jgi:hypothetical protein
VVDEQIRGQRQLKARLPASYRKIIIVKEPQPEPLIEPTDRDIDRPLREQAEPRKLAHREPLPSMLLSPSPGKGLHLFQILIRGTDQENGAGFDQQCGTAYHDEVTYEKVGAQISVARHAVKSAESGWSQGVARWDAAWPGQPGIAAQCAARDGWDHRQFTRRGLPRAKTG